MVQVHNLMEDFVKACLKDLTQQHQQLSLLNEKALSDILAIALNRLPPRYVSTPKGEVIAKSQLGMQAESDVYRELSYAIDKVLTSERKSELR